MKISVVSPHRDDACFSVGLLLGRLAKAGHRVRVVNCFTRSAYAPFSDAESVHANDRMSFVSALRAKEDLVFLRRLPGAAMVDLRLKDAPLRFRCDVAEVRERSVDRADHAMDKIAAALMKLLTPDQVDICILPLGIGHHVDHATTRDALLSIARRLPCGFYEDLPYAAWDGAEPERLQLLKNVSTEIGSDLSPLRCEEGGSAVEKKRDLARIYVSQIDEGTVDTIAGFAAQYEGERIWANEELAQLERRGIPGWSNAQISSLI